MKITFESKDYPKKTIEVKSKYSIRALIWDLYNKHIDSVIKVNNNKYLADDITCIIEKWGNEYVI